MKRMKSLKLDAGVISYACAACDKEFDIEVEEFREGRFSGPPEDCYPDEGGGFEPVCCPGCGAAVDEYRVSEAQRDTTEARRCDEADFRRKDKMEGY